MWTGGWAAPRFPPPPPTRGSNGKSTEFDGNDNRCRSDKGVVRPRCEKTQAVTIAS